MSTNFGFTGEPTDPNGLVYLRNRYYNPDTGIFMSLDPHEGTPNRPMSLNGYSYAEGNPTNLVDPNGTQACPIGFVPDGRGGCVAANDACHPYSDNVNSGNFDFSQCLTSDATNPFQISRCKVLGNVAAQQVRGANLSSPNGGCIVEVASYDITAGQGHAWVIFTDRTGTEWEFRAGREASFDFDGDGVNEETFSDCRAEGGGFWGFICATERPFRAGSGGGIDAHFVHVEGRAIQERIVLQTGEQACAARNELREVVNQVNAAEIRYDPTGPNSNTFASTMLDHLNLHNIQPSPPLPGWNNGSLIE